MPVGSSLYQLHDGRLAQIVVRLLGTGDFHSHLRIAPLTRFFRTASFTTNVPTVLEIGCGSGKNLFELSAIRRVKGTGIDINRAAIEVATMAARRLGCKHFAFLQADATTYTPTSCVDCLLLMDILEHVPDPAELVGRLDRYVKAGGYLIVSVPTPVFPKVFGKRFHQEIGHVVDGYRLPDLGEMIPDHYTLLHAEYHTGIMVWPACFLHYRFVRHISVRWLRRGLTAMLAPFRWFDVVKGERTAASLFAVYQKQGTTP